MNDNFMRGEVAIASQATIRNATRLLGQLYERAKHANPNSANDLILDVACHVVEEEALRLLADKRGRDRDEIRPLARRMIAVARAAFERQLSEIASGQAGRA